jgi:hypothetical protein
VRYFYDVNDLLFSFAVFAVIPLLLAAVFRCYLAAGGFKKPEFLRPGEDPPLYFPGIISGISECGDPMMCCVLREYSGTRDSPQP